MSLENIRSECSEFAALLQPHVDGELADEEQRRVSDHLEHCGACRAAVSEQMWVRATLRSIEREPAPSGLRANILAALDEADAADDSPDVALPESAEGSVRDDSGPISLDKARKRRGGRLRDLLRGGMVMVPAAAVAAGLFFVARGGLEPVESLPGPGLSAALSEAGQTQTAPAANENPKPALTQLDDIRPQLDFPLQVAPSRPEERVQLVGARLDPAAGTSGLGARLRYRIGEDRHVIDRQRPIGGPSPAGTTVVFRGQPYTVSNHAGATSLHFEHGGVAHQLTLEGHRGIEGDPGPVDVDSPDFAVLLDMAHQLARDSGTRAAAGR